MSVTVAVWTTAVTPLVPRPVIVITYRPGTTFEAITNGNVVDVPVVTGFDANDALTPEGNADMLKVTSCGLPTTVRVNNGTDGCAPWRVDTDALDKAKSFAT